MSSTLRTRLLTLPVVLLALLSLFLGFSGEAHAAAVSGGRAQTPQHSRHVADSGSTAVTTFKNDNNRTGVNSDETTLTPDNVNAKQFGKKLAYPVDGAVYAQPLYVPNLTINGNTYNVVFVVTEHDSVYAFDADATDPAQGVLWHTSYVTNGETPVPWTDTGCSDMKPESGITGTPVIDSNTHTMYFVTATRNAQGQHFNRLHALNILTGKDEAGSPITIQATVGNVSFNALYERQRAALLLTNNNIYISWSSFCDYQPQNGYYHGWVMAYNYSGSAFRQRGVFLVTPDGEGAGVWGSGGSLATDSSGDIYFVSGNGTFNVDAGNKSYGDSFVKLSPDLSQVVDYFTPFNQSCLQAADADLGSGGFVLPPDYPVLIGAGKEGRIYVLNTGNMGKYHTIANPCSNQGRTDVDQVLQETPNATIGGFYSNPVYWNDTVYLGSVNQPIMAFALNSNGQLSSATDPTSQGPEAMGFTGANPVISWDGSSTDSAILWAIDPSATLRAYKATDLSNELYNSDQNPARDQLDNYVKFSSPTVADGQVFVGTQDQLVIFGETTKSPPPASATYNNVGVSSDAFNPQGNYDGGGYSYSATALQKVGIRQGESIIYNNVAFVWPNLLPGSRDNYLATGQTIQVKAPQGTTTLAFLGSATNGSTSGTAKITYSDNSVQSFTLGFTDWAVKTPLFGNRIVATMPYRNSATSSNGKQTINVYLFYADVAVNPAKQIKSITLPPSTAPSALHVFAIGTKGNPGSYMGSYNNIGTASDNSTSLVANFDGAGNGYSAQALQSVGVNPGDNAFFNHSTGVVFQWPAPTSGQANNYIALGQTIPVDPVNNASLLAFAGAATNGPSSGTATINYSDGSHQNFTLCFSDWTLNGGQLVAPGCGNQVMYQMSYRDSQTLNGPENVKTYIFYTHVALQHGKTIASVTLPATVNHGQLHVFAISTKAETTSDPQYNNAGTSDDSNPALANFDGGGYSYSAQALQAAGVTPWQPLTYNGVIFSWPNVGSGGNNNYVTSGQTLSLGNSSSPPIQTIGFLGAANNAPASGLVGTVTVTYADGTKHTFNLCFSDWTLAAGRNQPACGNAIVVTTAYRNSSTGRNNIKTYVFYAEIDLPAAATVTSVTLPTTSGVPRIHIFAIGTK